MKSTIKLPFFNELVSNLQQEKPFIQVILGPRQVGKTTTVQYFIKHHYKQKALYLSADAILGPGFNWLLEAWDEARRNYDLLVIDEIQKIDNWSEMVKKFWDEDRKEGRKLQCLFLGSSSLDIQKGLSESLTGRFQLIRAHHWNFAESNKLQKMTMDEFLKYGGYPGSYSFLHDQEKFIDYVQNSIVATVIDKDILNNHTVKSPSLFRQAFELIMAYPAQEISYTKLLGQLQDKGNTELIKYYLSLYEGAYLVKVISKYSDKPVLRKTSSPKLIPLCPSLYFLTKQDNYTDSERGRAFEAQVGAVLSRLPVELFYWREGKHEVDFVVKKGKKLAAIEVKSGKRLTSRGLEEFCKKFPHAKPIIITMENYLELEKLGLQFIF